MESWWGGTAAPSGPVLKISQLKTLKDPETFARQVTQGISILLNVICLVWGQNDGHTSAQGSQQLAHQAAAIQLY